MAGAAELLTEAHHVLGLDRARQPSEEEIQAAFKKLALQWHPDKNRTEEATARFAEISAARDLLLDPAAAHSPQPNVAPAGTERAGGASSELRRFEGDVTREIDEGRLHGPQLDALFANHGLWAVWVCEGCALVCARIRKDKYVTAPAIGWSSV
eukprot:scaffold186090_cov34-Tisochrysis_lutea.AAC.5